MTITIARTAGNRLAKRSALELQVALDAIGERVTVRAIREAFDEDFDLSLARLRAMGVDVVEVPMSVLDARTALRELSAA